VIIKWFRTDTSKPSPEAAAYAIQPLTSCLPIWLILPADLRNLPPKPLLSNLPNLSEGWATEEKPVSLRQSG